MRHGVESGNRAIRYDWEPLDDVPGDAATYEPGDEDQDYEPQGISKEQALVFGIVTTMISLLAVSLTIFFVYSMVTQ